MKRLVLTIALASLAALVPVGGAASRPRECPTIAVACPEGFVSGAPVTFTATVNGGPADAKITYNWIISAGTIVSGQGTSSISVDTTGVSSVSGASTLTATVEVGGFAESCPASQSCSVNMPQVCYLGKIDEYGNLRFSDEKARLDNYAIELRNEPTVAAHLICYGGRRSYAGEARSRCERAANYLKRTAGIEDARVVILDGGHREELTVELWVSPVNIPPPMASPTVDPTEVIIVKRKPRRQRTPR